MIRIELRPDQIECVEEALAYCIARFDGVHAAPDQQPAVRLACRLAKARCREILTLIDHAVKAAT